MCSAFTPDCGYGKGTNILIGDVYCPYTKCLCKFCLQKKTFQSFGRSDYQCPQCASVCQVRNIPFEDRTKSYFLSFGQGVYIFEERPKSFQDVIGDVYCPKCRNEKCVYISTRKRLVSTTVKKAKPAATSRIFLVRTKKRQLCCLAVTAHNVLQERRVVTTKKRNHLHFWKNFSANQFQANPRRHQKRLNWVQIWNKFIRFLLANHLSNIFIFQIVLFNFNLRSTDTQLTVNLQKILIFSVCNDGIQRTIDFAPDSITIAIIDLVQNVTISSQEIPLAAWQLLLSQMQDFFDKHLPRVPITQNQEGTMEMRDEGLSSVGAQGMDTSS